VALLQREGHHAAVVCADDYRELLGVNTLEQLAEAERVHGARVEEGSPDA
jgi:bifunctional N-acetylglucosamine-1-phosphate-uridyltransferase/glucosamine-1-phosphate-acetyltransferase GlmU-like protein